MQRFRGGLVFKAHGLCVSLNSRLKSNKGQGRRRGWKREAAGRSHRPGSRSFRGSIQYCSRTCTHETLEDNCFSKLCSGSEAGSCLRLKDVVYHSTLGLGVRKGRGGGVDGSEKPPADRIDQAVGISADQSRDAPESLKRDWYFTAEKPAPAQHLAHPEGCAALRIVLVTVPRVSRSCEHFPDGFDLHLLHKPLNTTPGHRWELASS